MVSVHLKTKVLFEDVHIFAVWIDAVADFVHVNLDDRADRWERGCIASPFQLSTSRDPPSIIYSALYKKDRITQSWCGSRFLLLWEMLRNCNALPSLFSYFDNSIQDFRCPFQPCCTWKQSVAAHCYACTVFYQWWSRIFLSHVFHLILRRVLFFWGEPVLSFCRTKWLTTVWPLVV